MVATTTGSDPGERARRPSPDAGALIAATAMSGARRFAAGATMWCVAPDWRDHARHIAVEFVHPVVVGTRALPAVSVDGPDVVARLRNLVAAGDIVTVVGAGDDPVVRAIVARTPAWGATSIWIGAGDRPARNAADHLLWVDDDALAAAHDGRLTFQYHVLWELIHVCLDHPGLLAGDPPSGTDEKVAVCVTCSDEGRLGEVISVSGVRAQVRTATGVEPVDTTIVAAVRPGDLLLIHAGTAIAVIDETTTAPVAR